MKRLTVTVHIEPGATFDDVVDAFRREVVCAALDANEGNIPQAAKDLGRSRSGLWREIWERHGVRTYVPEKWRTRRSCTVGPGGAWEDDDA